MLKPSPPSERQRVPEQRPRSPNRMIGQPEVSQCSGLQRSGLTRIKFGGPEAKLANNYSYNYKANYRPDTQAAGSTCVCRYDTDHRSVGADGVAA